MVRITLNGASVEFPDDAAVIDAAAHVGVTPADAGVAVAMSSQVIPRDAWATTPLSPGADVEVVRAAAGG